MTRSQAKDAAKPPAKRLFAVVVRVLVAAALIVVLPLVFVAATVLLPFSLVLAVSDVGALVIPVWIVAGITGLVGLARAGSHGAGIGRKTARRTQLMIAVGVAAAIPPAAAAGFALLHRGPGGASPVAAVLSAAFTVLVVAGIGSIWRLHRAVRAATSVERRDTLPAILLGAGLVLLLTVLVVAARL